MYNLTHDSSYRQQTAAALTMIPDTYAENKSCCVQCILLKKNIYLICSALLMFFSNSLSSSVHLGGAKSFCFGESGAVAVAN